MKRTSLQPTIFQPPFEGFVPAPVAPPSGHKRRRVAETISRLRALHDELNSLLQRHPDDRPAVQSPGEAMTILEPFLAGLEHEELWLLVLDSRFRVMEVVALYRGSINTAQVRVAEVFRQAVISNAAAILVAHNHPSGQATPSADDIALTRALVQAGQLLDIQVLDHLVIGHGCFVSMNEKKLGFA